MRVVAKNRPLACRKDRTKTAAKRKELKEQSITRWINNAPFSITEDTSRNAMSITVRMATPILCRLYFIIRFFTCCFIQLSFFAIMSLFNFNINILICNRILPALRGMTGNTSIYGYSALQEQGGDTATCFQFCYPHRHKACPLKCLRHVRYPQYCRLVNPFRIKHFTHLCMIQPFNTRPAGHIPCQFAQGLQPRHRSDTPKQVFL